MLIGLAVAFLAGAALAGYGMWRFGDAWVGDGPPARAVAASRPAPAAAPPASPTPDVIATPGAQEAVAAAQIVAEQQGGLDQRLAAAEQRIARLDLQAQAASGNAARAEGLLIAFAARRTLDRGNPLGYLEDQLRLRFGDAMPAATRTLIAFGRQPVTLEQLVARLEGLAPELSRSSGQASWARLRSDLTRLFVVRRESTPSPQPRQRLERARLFLQSGRVREAIAEVRNLPGAATAGDWIRDAERYAGAQDALDLIETAAVLEPRRLRDGEGRAIEQPSPVAGRGADAAPAGAASGAR